MEKKYPGRRDIFFFLLTWDFLSLQARHFRHKLKTMGKITLISDCKQRWLLWWLLLLPDDTYEKNFRIPKGDFEAFVAELRPYISPNPLSPNHRAPNAEKKVAITLYYLKDTASIGIVVNSFGVAICTVA